MMLSQTRRVLRHLSRLPRLSRVPIVPSLAFVPRYFSAMSTGITRYGETFAFVPRTKGIADITVNTSPVFETKVVFQTKDAYAASASGSLAAADAANRPISVTYEKDGSGKEVRVVTVCIGEAAKVDAQGLRKHANAAVNHLRTLKVAEADFVLPAVDDIPTNVVAEVVGQSVLLSNYHFDRYLTEADKVRK